MDEGLRAQIQRELSPAGWSPENHAKLVDFLSTYARENAARPAPAPLALFDADNTTWTGDMGDSAFVYLVKNLKLSARVDALLPASLEVPAAGYGLTAPGRLFPVARVKEALSAMLREYRAAVAPAADLASMLAAFEEGMILPGGPLAGCPRFLHAHAVYQGVFAAVYNLLDAQVGRAAFDFEGARVASSLYPDLIRDFYGWEVHEGGKELARFARPGADGRYDILFPRILDTEADQHTRRAAGKLGSYTQIAAWVALDKTPEALRRIALEVWNRSPGAVLRHEMVFPVDAPGAASPHPLDFSGRFTPGASAGEGVALGITAMEYGTAVRPPMVELMAVMSRHGITPAVVSATQADLVQSVLEEVYHLTTPVAGMAFHLHEGAYRVPMLAPATFRSGKVEAAREIARRVGGSAELRPVFCAGDSETDLELLAYSSDYRLFFDRGRPLFMSLSAYLAAHGAARSTLVQAPFERGA